MRGGRGRAMWGSSRSTRVQGALLGGTNCLCQGSGREPLGRAIKRRCFQENDGEGPENFSSLQTRPTESGCCCTDAGGLCPRPTQRAARCVGPAWHGQLQLPAAAPPAPRAPHAAVSQEAALVLLSVIRKSLENGILVFIMRKVVLEIKSQICFVAALDIIIINGLKRCKKFL